MFVVGAYFVRPLPCSFVFYFFRICWCRGGYYPPVDLAYSFVIRIYHTSIIMHMAKFRPRSMPHSKFAYALLARCGGHSLAVHRTGWDGHYLCCFYGLWLLLLCDAFIVSSAPLGDFALRSDNGSALDPLGLCPRPHKGLLAP